MKNAADDFEVAVVVDFAAADEPWKYAAFDYCAAAVFVHELGVADGAVAVEQDAHELSLHLGLHWLRPRLRRLHLGWEEQRVP